MIRTIFGALLTIIISSTVVWAQNCGAPPNQLVNGTNADANQVMANFNAIVNCGLRLRLSAPLTYYVRSDGSDSNNGLSNTAAGAFATLQKAYNVIAGTIDLGGQTVTVQVNCAANPCTFAPSSGVSSVAAGTSWVGGGTVVFNGDSTTPSNVTLSTTGNADVVACSAPISGTLKITGFTLTAAGTGSNAVNINSPGCLVQIDKVIFGAVPNAHLNVSAPGSSIQGIPVGNYTISGGAASHAQASFGGQIQVRNQTITLSSTPSFIFGFAVASTGGNLRMDALTFGGTGASSTTRKFEGETNGVIYTNTGNLNYFPGTIAGVLLSGAQYN
jgi:hypothetical protein